MGASIDAEEAMHKLAPFSFVSVDESTEVTDVVAKVEMPRLPPLLLPVFVAADRWQQT